MHDAVVIGGGISGLTAGWQLLRLGLDVVVLEAQPTAGGNIRTVDHEGFKLELGPYSFLGGSEHVWRLIEELDLEGQTERSSAVADNRFIYRNERLVPLPLGVGSFLTTPLLSWRGKLRLMAEPFIRNGAQPDDTAWQFFVRRFGLEAATFIMGPFVSGIYAGDPQLLGARAAFPKFYDFEREAGSMIRGSVKYMFAKRRRMKREGLKSRKGIYSLEGGLGSLTGEVARRLGERLHTGAAVSGVLSGKSGYIVTAGQDSWEAHTVICAIPPRQAAAALGELAPGVVEPLRQTPMSPVSLVHWSQPEDVGQLPVGFGFLMPRIFDLRVLGTIFASQLFANRAPAGQALFTSYYGGMLDPSAMDLSDSELLALLRAEHRRIFGVELVVPPMSRVIRYPEAIPQLTPSHPRRMDDVRAALADHPGVFMAGNYLTGVGVEHATQSGYLAAADAQAYLAKRSVEVSKESHDE